jgi:hypothetical protein
MAEVFRRDIEIAQADDHRDSRRRFDATAHRGGDG